VLPFPAGGGIDIVGRALGTKLSKALGQSVVIDNRPGADGLIGAEMVAKSSPDGYTLLLASTDTLAINPALYPKLPYNTLRDFAPITLVVDQPMCLVVDSKLPVKSVQELVALAKANPGKLNFASPGVGNAIHLAGEIFKTTAAIDIVHVPYKGSVAAITEIIAGQVQMMISSIPQMLPYIKSAKLRAPAVSSPNRMELLPDVPTLREVGFPQIKISSWYGLVAPAGTFKEIIARLNNESVTILHTKEMTDYLAQQGSEAVGNSPDEFRAHLKSELTKWAEAVRSSGAKLQ
jgi:tripartite-type tricarboxylate transporter receptor subunit TctC